MPRWCPPLLAVCALLGAGCSPAIGDSCDNSTDCSIDGERICDIAQPGGYCTIQGCDPDTCPDGARCVEWRYDPTRTASTWCMEKCNGNGGCRQGDGYRCVSTDDPVLLDEDGMPLARIIDQREGRRESSFCAAIESPGI